MRHTNKRKPLHLSLALLLPGLVLFGAVTALTNSLPLLGNDSEAQAVQSIPYRINFQGRLTDNNGNILPDGNYNMRFRFYDAPTGGTQQWSENRTGGDRVQLTNGLFNLQFGEVASLPPSVFSTYPLYLEVELPTPSTNTSSSSPDWSEGPFTPRQRIASTPYAFNADQLDGRDSSEFAQLDPSSQQSGSINIGGNIQAGGSLQGSSLNVSGGGSFTGQVSGGDAQNSNEFTTLSQLQSAAGDAADSGVTSLQGLDGALTIQGTAQIDVGTSGGTTIGLALHADSIGNEHLEYNTGQHLTTTSSPTFAAVTAGFFTGDGSGLTNLNASNITSGTVADARLSSNVALLNANQTFTGNNVFDGQLSIGTASQLGQLTLGNNQWITGVNAAGNGGINMMRVNEQNQIQLGASLAIDGGFNFPTDGGLVTFTDMQVTNASSVGSPMGYALRLDSDNMLTLYSEADGSGGTQNRQLQAFADLSFQQSASISTVSGDLTLSPAGNTVISSNLNVSGAVTANSFSGDGSGLTSLNASNISSGTLADARLSSNVTLQGNTFNGANQLVQLNASGHLPVLNASNLTNLNANNISSGTLADARLSSNVALLNANANFTANLQQGGNDVCTIAGNCAGQGGMGDILQGGNSFGTAMNIGTNDNFDLNLRTNGTTRLTVTSGGNVGIGTASPQGQLEINATTPTFYLQTADPGYNLRIRSQFNSTNSVDFASGGTTFLQYGQANGGVTTVGRDNAGAKVILNGNVGIGTTSPSEKLHVDGNILAVAGRFHSGTPSAPAYSFNGSPDMGMYRPSDGNLGFVTAGTEQLRVTSSGSIRLYQNALENFVLSWGTQGSGDVVIPGFFHNELSNWTHRGGTVTETLDNVSAGSSLDNIYSPGRGGDQTRSYNPGGAGANATVEFSDNTISAYGSGSGARLYVVSRVGNTPDQILAEVKDGNGSWQTIVNDTSPMFRGNTWISPVVSGLALSHSGVRFTFTWDSSGSTWWLSEVGYRHVNAPMGVHAIPYVNQENTFFADQYFNQNVGIGTTSPSERLHVAGNGLLTGSVTADNFQGSGAGLTNLNASNISSGTLSDSRLSSNVTLQGNTFNGANQLVQLNASGHLPVLNASNLTNLNASNISTGTLANARLTNSGALTVTAGTGLSGGGSVALGGSTTINLNTTYLNNNYFAQGGNTFGATATMGTTDNNALRLITNNNEAMRIDTSGNVGINTTNPQRTLDVSGEARIQGSDPNTVSMVVEGAIDQIAGILEVRSSVQDSLLYVNQQEVAINASDGWSYSGHTGNVHGTAVSPDGNVVYSSGADGEVHALDADDGSWQWTYSGHSDVVLGLAVSPDGNTIYSASADNQVHAINASNGSFLWDYTSHTNNVNRVAASPDGNAVYSGSDDGQVHAINASNGSQLWTYTHVSSVHGVVVSPDSNTVYASSTIPGEVHAVDATNNGAHLWTYDDFGGFFNGAVTGLEVSPDGNTVYGLNPFDGEIQALDATNNGAHLWTNNTPSTSFVAGDPFTISPNGQTIFYGARAASKGTLHAINARNGLNLWAYTSSVSFSNNFDEMVYNPERPVIYLAADELYAFDIDTIDQSRVGIGTDDPEAALHVAGDAMFRNETDQEQAFNIQDAAGNTLFNTDTLNNRLTIGSSDDEFKKISDPSTLPAGTSNGVGWSPDGRYMAVAHDTSPYITIYKRDGDTFTKLSNPSTLPTGSGQGVSWSPDGRYMSVAHNTSPFVTIYKRDGDTFTKLTDPTLPTGAGQETAWSPDSQYMAVAHETSPYVTIYSRSGDDFNKISNPGTLPTGHGRSVSWSPSTAGGYYLAVGHENSPRVTVYNILFGATKLSNPSTLPTGTGHGVTWSPGGAYLNVAHASSPWISTYTVNYNGTSTSFTKRPDPADLPGSTGYNASWSSDGRYMAVSHNLTPRITIYQHNGNGTFTKLSNPDYLPPDVGWDAEFSPSGQYLSVAHSTGPFISIYRYGIMTTVHGTIEINNISVGGTINGQAESGGALALRMGRQNGTIAQFVTGSNGNICQVTTSFSCSSDERLKTNIEDMSAEESLDKIMQLESVNFNWLQQPDGSVQSGFIAQQIREIMPELVETSENGYLTLDKAGFVPYLVGGMQQQQGQIISLQGENASQSNLIDLITKRVDDMEEYDINNLTAKQVNHESRLDAIEDKLASYDFGATTQSTSTGTSYLQNGDSASFSKLNVSGKTTLGKLTVSDTAVFEGEVVVQELEVETDLYVGGRVVSRGEEPEAELPELLEDIAEVVIIGTDTTGRIEIKIDDELDEEDEEELKKLKRLTHVIFNKAFGENTHMQVHLTPANRAGASLGIYADMDDDSGEKFSIRILEELEPGKTYQFSYFVSAAEISQDD